MDQDDAAQALDALKDAKGRLAASLDCPPWRHVAFGLLEALVMLGASMRGIGTGIFYLASFGLALLLWHSDRSRTGAFVNGWRRGKTLPLAFALALGMVALVLLAVQHRTGPLPSLQGLIAAALALVLGTAASVWWQKIYIDELTSGGQS